jgi:glucose dehydrogenase
MRDAEAGPGHKNLRLAMLVLVAAMPWSAAGAQAQSWSVYGGDAGGTRYSAVTELTKANVARLRIAWTYHTGDAARRGASFARSSLEVTPILASGKLVFCTPFDRVIALDATSGSELWVFDPVLPADLHPANDAICRGVAVWHDATVAAEATCADRVFLGTNDARLIALDLATGKPCAGFGSNGEITLPPDVPPLYQGELHIESAPILVNDVVVVGSAVDDMSRARAPSGTVFAFDPRTGEKRWGAALGRAVYAAQCPSTLLFPFSGAGVNWGGGAFDPGRGLYIVNTNRIAHVVKLIPRADYAAAHAADPKVEIGRGLGTPYAARREVLLSPLGLPCNSPPWGTLAALAPSSGRCPSACRPMVAL